MLRRLSLAIAALLTLAAAPPRPVAHPALWLVEDRDTRIYLFGTVHVLPDGERWFEGKVRQAFDAAGEVAIETVAPPPAEAGRLLMARAIDPQGRTLPDLIPQDLHDRLKVALLAARREPDMLDRFEPWYASTLLTFLALEDLQIRPGSGVEPALTTAAATAGKPLIGLEGFDEQLALLDTLSPDKQASLLDETIDEFPKAKDEIGPMIAAWERGDAKALAALMNEGLKDVPELRTLLLDQRNARFAAWIADRLKRPGTVFLAVGAGHLGGDDSVQVWLARQGLKAKRVQ